jgi:hypothetical protein
MLADASMGKFVLKVLLFIITPLDNMGALP